MATKNLLAKLIILLGFVSAGVQGAWAVSPSFWIKDVGYFVYASSGVDVVDVVAYRGNAETLTIPAYVNNGSKTYQVKRIKFFDDDISVDISSVKTLIFEGAISFSGTSSYPTFNCPALENIIFKAGVPNLTDSYSRYFGSRTGITAHVTGKTDDEIAEMKKNTAVWSEFADIVPYNEAVSETVNIYVTMEEDSPAHSAMFKINSSQYIYGSGSKVYTRNKHADLTFFVADGTYATTKNVFVNGKDVLQDMEADPEDSPFYDAENVKKYTLQDLKTDVYIRIIPQDKNDEFALSVGRGGKVVFEKNGTNTVQNNNTMYFSIGKTEHMPLTVIPDEGYELDFFWWDGTFITNNVGSQITIEPQGDGTYIYNVSGGGKFFVAFKPVGSSGSTVSTYDLNGDGFIDVSDIDKLIEEINKQ